MGYRVLLAGPARNEFEQAVTYVAVTLDSPRAAAALADEFEHKLDILGSNPLIYDVDRRQSEVVGSEVRRCMVKGYEAWFTVDDETHTVGIVAFLHGRQDASAALRGRG